MVLLAFCQMVAFAPSKYIAEVQPDLFALHADIEERHWWFVARRCIVLSVARRAVPPGRDTLVLDVGCGTGANAAAFARDYTCLAVDTSADAIARAARRYPEVSFVCGHVPDAIGEAMTRAALVLLTDVLEHVPDDFDLLSRILAGLQPGAHVLVTVPADEELWSPHDVSFGHYRRYGRTRLASVWAGLPVTVRLLSYFNARMYPAVRAIRAVTRLTGRTGGRSGTDFALPPHQVNRALEAVFAGERGRLLRAIDRPRDRGYSRGVSLIALLRRERGPLQPRARPAAIALDQHVP